ncbi:MAG: hypothetical protein M3350_03215 [Actinomycetota bacterium]|nr:hypothetical protein [Actinomycetota bacterium]
MATSDVIGTGTAGGLLAFCDDLLERDHASCGVVHPWKYAVKQVFTRLEGDNFEAIDVQSLDVDEYMQRFASLPRDPQEPDRLYAYHDRFPKAVEAYRGYLADPTGWRPA